MQNANLAEIQLRRTDKVWLYKFSTDGRFYRFINQANIRYPPNNAVEHSTDFARLIFNAIIVGLCVTVKGHFDSESRILTIQP
jgi:hypothetical protein